VVTLNRAVALAMVEGPEAGLALVGEVADRLGGNYRVDAVRAHLYEQAGDLDAALESYRAAARRTTNLQEQRYLTARAASCAPRAAAGRP
jgi:predicted RNA polymerase sigma factor